MEKIKPLLGLFIKFFLPAYLIFMILTFPMNDLKHVITSKISQATNQRVQLQFHELDLNLIPKPSLSLSDVTLFTPNMSPLRMKDLSVAPSFLDLLQFQLGVNIFSSNIFGGSLDATLAMGEKTKNDVAKQVVSLQASNLKLKQILDFLRSPFAIESDLSLRTNLKIDPSFQEGIDGTLNLNSPSINIQDMAIPTDMGSINLPAIQIQDIALKAKLENKKMTLEQGKIGKKGDTLYGEISGQANYTLMNTPSGPRLSNLSYDINVDLRFQNAFLNQLAFKPLIDSYLSPSDDDQSRLNIKLSANRLGAPPKISKNP